MRIDPLPKLHEVMERLESKFTWWPRADLDLVDRIYRFAEGMLGLKELSLLPKGAVVVNTARGPIIDIDALAMLLKSGHLAGVGLDVVPVEPPVAPVPELMRAYRAREDWTLGRLVITPHSAFYTPQAWEDIRSKSAETMRAALLGPRAQNVIPPESE